MLHLGAILAGLAVTAYALAVAVRVPPPELDDDEGGDKLLWDSALIAVVPVGLLWVVCLVGPAPVLPLFAAGCGVVMAHAVWILRVPRPGHDAEGGGSGGGGSWPEPPPSPAGGEPIDWDALERTVDLTSAEQRELVSV
jgi:hypothetical protein